jgi:hypothetical protein
MAGAYFRSEWGAYHLDAIVDEQGRMFAVASVSGSPEEWAQFSGVATVADASSRQWEIPDAWVQVGTKAPVTGQVTGSFDPSGTMTVSFAKPPAPAWVPDMTTSRPGNLAQPITLSGLAGTYIGYHYCDSFSIINGSCPYAIQASYTLDSAGRFKGTMQELVTNKTCSVDGVAEVADGHARILRARAHFTGPAESCPSGEVVMLGEYRPVDASGHEYIRWWYIRPDGRIERISQARRP